MKFIIAVFSFALQINKLIVFCNFLLLHIVEIKNSCQWNFILLSNVEIRCSFFYKNNSCFIDLKFCGWIIYFCFNNISFFFFCFVNSVGGINYFLPLILFFCFYYWSLIFYFP